MDFSQVYGLGIHTHFFFQNILFFFFFSICLISLLSINPWSGTLPTEIGQLVSLTKLYSYSCSSFLFLSLIISHFLFFDFREIEISPLGGTLPTEIGNLNQLKSLFFFSNIIVSFFKRMDFLTLLDRRMPSNSFRGTIFSEIGQMSHLEFMFLFFYLSPFLSFSLSFSFFTKRLIPQFNHWNNSFSNWGTCSLEKMVWSFLRWLWF